MELSWTVDVVMLRAARQDFSGSQVGSLGQSWHEDKVQVGILHILPAIDGQLRACIYFHLHFEPLRSTSCLRDSIGISFEVLYVSEEHRTVRATGPCSHA